jgi:hypothetical protein
MILGLYVAASLHRRVAASPHSRVARVNFTKQSQLLANGGDYSNPDCFTKIVRNDTEGTEASRKKCAQRYRNTRKDTSIKKGRYRMIV